MGAFADALQDTQDTGGTGITIRPASVGAFQSAMDDLQSSPKKAASTTPDTKDQTKKDFSWSSAVTDIPKEIKSAAGHAVEGITNLSKRGEQGPVEGLMTTGRAIMSVPELIASPITGAARSLIGHTMANTEHAAGTVIAPDIAAKDNPDAMYETAKGDTDLAMSALATRGRPAPVASVPPSVPPSQPIYDAAGRISSATGTDVNVPRAIASDNIAVQRIGQGIRNIPIVGDAIPKATADLTGQLSDATRSIADQHGSGSGPNVANRIGHNLQSAADAETQAATDAAGRSDEALTAAWQRHTDAAHQTIASHEANSLTQARLAVGDMSPQDMGETLISRLRAGEQQARATKEQLYGIAGNSDASINSDAVGAVRARVAQSLEDDGRVVDSVLTPASSRMMDELQRLSTMNIENRAVGAGTPAPAGEPPARVAVSVQGIEQTRKRLNAISQAATNDADRAAARRIIREFDNWQSDAFDNALFSGSDTALQAYRQARAANTDWRTRFGFNDRDDADRVVNRIVTGEVTPQEVSNWLVGASQVGSKGLSSRLLTRVAEATNNDPQALQAIRGGVWNRLTQTAQGVADKAPAKISNDIGEFINGSGRDVANRLLTPQQRAIAQTYADTLRRGAEARQMVAEVAGNTKPRPMEVGIGPMQELANKVLGRGGKADEALYSAIDAYAKSGSRGDIQTLARLVQTIPAQEKGDLAGAVIRNLGISPRTGQFSPDVFVSQWRSYTPQAKTLLLGNAGPQRQALDDIAMISDRLKQVGAKFGNPSGTAQNVNFAALAGSFFAAPLTTMTTAVGGWTAAKILSSPAGASSAAKWTKAYAALTTRPSAQTIGLFQTASRNLANTAQTLGLKASAIDFMRALQSPVLSGAHQDQEQ